MNDIYLVGINGKGIDLATCDKYVCVSMCDLIFTACRKEFNINGHTYKFTPIENTTENKNLIFDLEKKRPLSIESMASTLKRVGIPSNDVGLYVATTTGDFTYGAGVLAYPHFFERARAIVGDDFYIIPSSIHEVILFSADMYEEGDPRGELLELVKSVNQRAVLSSDRLSDNVYLYHSRTGVLEDINGRQYHVNLEQKENK